MGDKKMIQNRRMIIWVGLGILFVLALSAWLDSQDAGDAKRARKIAPMSNFR